MRFIDWRDALPIALAAAVFAFAVGSIGYAIHSRGLDYQCEDECHEQHHNFSRINTAGECVCGDAAK